MKVFGLKPEGRDRRKPAAVVVPGGDGEGLSELLAWKFKPAETTISPEELRAKLHAAIGEASQWFSTRIEGMARGVSVDTVAVQLGITVGGEVGLFAKGRADVAASFTVSLKLGSPKPTPVPRARRR